MVHSGEPWWWLVMVLSGDRPYHHPCHTTSCQPRKRWIRSTSSFTEQVPFGMRLGVEPSLRATTQLIKIYMYHSGVSPLWTIMCHHYEPSCATTMNHQEESPVGYSKSKLKELFSKFDGEFEFEKMKIHFEFWVFTSTHLDTTSQLTSRTCKNKGWWFIVVNLGGDW